MKTILFTLPDHQAQRCSTDQGMLLQVHSGRRGQTWEKETRGKDHRDCKVWEGGKREDKEIQLEYLN